MIVEYQERFLIKLKYTYIPICILILIFLWIIDPLLVSFHDVLVENDIIINRKILRINSYNCTLSPNICANGYCFNSTCICNPRYATIYYDDGSIYKDTYCNYYQKSAYTAYVLEATLGLFGAGYFYIEQYMLGLLQLIFFLLLMCSLGCRICCFCASQKEINMCGKRVMFFMYCCSMVPLIFWWIYATIDIKSLNRKDGSNVLLYDDL